MRATVLSTLCFSKTVAATAPETTGVSDLESNESNFLFEPPPRPPLLEELLKLRFMVTLMNAVVSFRGCLNRSLYNVNSEHFDWSSHTCMT